MARQLNVFMENRPGRLMAVTERIFKTDASINIIAFTIQDRGDFGVMKLLVDKPDQAHLSLVDKGFACALKEILVIEAKDKPGNLYRLTALLSENGINVVDAYGFVVELGKRGICCLDIDTKQLAKARGILEKAGFSLLEEDELRSF